MLSGLQALYSPSELRMQVCTSGSSGTATSLLRMDVQYFLPLALPSTSSTFLYIIFHWRIYSFNIHLPGLPKLKNSSACEKSLNNSLNDSSNICCILKGSIKTSKLNPGGKPLKQLLHSYYTRP